MKGLGATFKTQACALKYASMSQGFLHRDAFNISEFPSKLVQIAICQHNLIEFVSRYEDGEFMLKTIMVKCIS